jgi:hypothetical protein
MKIMVRWIAFAFVWLPLAWAQTEQLSAGLPAAATTPPALSTVPKVGTPAAVTTPATTPAAAATLEAVTTPEAVTTKDQESLLDKVMGIAGPAEPGELTRKKRFHLYLLSVMGPVPLLAETAGAGWGQLRDTPKAWGQGWSAFGERAESNLAYNGLRQTITYGTSILFHEDNRYFSSHKHGIWGRTEYAVVAVVTARHPDGREAFSISSVTGVLGAGAISSIWGPRSWEGVAGIARNAGISFGVTAVFNIVREFLPDFQHRSEKSISEESFKVR